MQALCRQIGLSSIDEIVALIALYRPGPMEWIPDYVRGKKEPEHRRVPAQAPRGSLHETYGVMVYQEQVMEAAKIIAGYTLGGADMLRRAMGKKDADAMAKERAKFVEGAAKVNKIDARTANSIFEHPQQICRLRLQQIPLGRLRRPQLPDRLPQGQLPDAVHGGDADL